MSEPVLPCPACGAPAGLETILDRADTSWPLQHWLWFDCPACGDGSHVELRGSSVSIGELDGAPGPCFLATATIEAPGLTMTSTANAVIVRYNGRVWQIPARL